MANITETWGAGAGTAWTVAQGADNDWTLTAIRIGGFTPSIASGEGVLDGFSNLYSHGYMTVDTPSLQDVESLFEFSVDAGEVASIFAVLRRTGSDTYYLFGYDDDNSTGPLGGLLTIGGYFIAKRVAGTVTVLAETSAARPTGSFQIRARVEGSALKLKIWSGTEPGAWTLETTDTDITAAGLVGIGAGSANTALSLGFTQFDGTEVVTGESHERTISSVASSSLVDA